MAKEYFSFLEVEGDVVDVSIGVENSERYQWNATVYAPLALMDTLGELFMWLDADTILSGLDASVRRLGPADG